MKFRQKALVSALAVAMVAASGAAVAARGGGFSGGHGGWHYGHGFGPVGAFVGGAIIAGALLAPWPRYYGGPYYYPSYPAVIEVAPLTPISYIEQPRPAQAAVPDAGSWWYYCNESRAYYPYVRECPSPWQRVAPTPPTARQ